MVELECDVVEEMNQVTRNHVVLLFQHENLNGGFYEETFSIMHVIVIHNDSMLKNLMKYAIKSKVCERNM